MIKTSLIASLCAVAFTGMAQNATPPTVVFYLTDDMGWNDSQLYNPTSQVRTPNLVKLASQGMVFNNAFIASPACAPSRAALLTGLMPARNGAEENHSYPPNTIPLLHKQLQQNGYEVAAFGKVAHGAMNEACGFDFYNKKMTDLTKNVTEFLKNRKSDKPLALFIGDRRPHVPWTDELLYNPDEIVIPPFLINTIATREHRAMYYSDITGIDAEVGKVNKLIAQNVGENVLFLFSSDHGGQWPFGKWNLYDAGTRVPLLFVWPGKIKPASRTNAMVSWIDILPTLIELTGSGSTPENIDGRSFANVLLKGKKSFRKQIFTTHSGDLIMNVYPIRSVRDQRFKFILNLHPEFYHTNHSDILRKHGAGEYWNSWDSVAKLDENAKMLIARYYQRPSEEFFDLKSDPYEMNNRINDPKYAKIIDQMRNDLNQWMEEQGDKKTVFREPYFLYEGRPGNDIKIK
jgi:N-sulfoglucosamine sulfohydrolase